MCFSYVDFRIKNWKFLLKQIYSIFLFRPALFVLPHWNTKRIQLDYNESYSIFRFNHFHCVLLSFWLWTTTHLQLDRICLPSILLNESSWVPTEGGWHQMADLLGCVCNIFDCWVLFKFSLQVDPSLLASQGNYMCCGFYRFIHVSLCLSSELWASNS